MAKQHVSGKNFLSHPNLDLEGRAWNQGHRYVAGVDEAGRGPLAGPVVTAAVILGPDWNTDYPLNDSKKLSLSLRESLFHIIRKHSLAYRIVSVSPGTIDRLNILQATLQGMQRAVNELKVSPDYVLVDGNHAPPFSCPGEPVIKGDARSCSIAAASILAKVARDRIMTALGRLYPEWGFEKHKGYPTAQHRDAIERYGICVWHRRSFRQQKPEATQLSLL